MSKDATETAASPGDETDQDAERYVRPPKEIVSILKRKPGLTIGAACLTLGIYWFSFKGSAPPAHLAGASALFFFLWMSLAAVLPGVFRLLFLGIVVTFAAGSFYYFDTMTSTVGAGLVAFSWTLFLALALIVVFRAEVLVPAAAGALVGLGTYLQLGGGLAAAVAGVLACVVVFVFLGAVCYLLAPFVVGFLWMAAMGLLACKAVSLLLGAPLIPVGADGLITGAKALMEKGGSAFDLWAVLLKAWAPIAPPDLLGGWITLVSGGIGAMCFGIRTGRLSSAKPLPPDEDAHKSLDMGEQLLREERFDEALKFFDKVAAVDTVLRPTGRFYVALTLLRKGEDELGKRSAARIDIKTLSKHQRYQLAVELENCGELEEAVSYYESVAESDKDYRDVGERLEDLRRRLADVSGDEIAHLLAKRVIDKRYKGIKLLARGAMGFVFRGLDSTTAGRLVAIKVMSPLLKDSDGSKESKEKPDVRFIREAEMVAKIDHPNVIRIFDLYPGKVPYYTMEFLEAESLGELLKKRGRLAPAQAADVAIQICDGLHSAHQQGIVHRDVKPANVLLEDNMSVKLVDFGVAKFAEATKLTQTGAAVGTPLYMSPEQVRGEEADLRSDIYSAGVVLYEMAVGRPPFAEMMHHATMQVPPPPAEAGVPEALHSIMLRAMMKPREERYQAADQLAYALRQWRAGPSVPASQKGDSPPSGGLIDLSQGDT